MIFLDPANFTRCMVFASLGYRWVARDVRSVSGCRCAGAYLPSDLEAHAEKEVALSLSGLVIAYRRDQTILSACNCTLAVIESLPVLCTDAVVALVRVLSKCDANLRDTALILLVDCSWLLLTQRLSMDNQGHGRRRPRADPGNVVAGIGGIACGVV